MQKILAGSVVSLALVMAIITIYDFASYQRQEAKIHLSFNQPELKYAIQTDDPQQIAMDSMYSLGYRSYMSHDSAKYFLLLSNKSGLHSFFDAYLMVAFSNGWHDAEKGRPNFLKPSLIAFLENPDLFQTGVFTNPNIDNHEIFVKLHSALCQDPQN